MSRHSISQTIAVAALLAVLSGCNLTKKEDEYKAPEGTIVIPPDEARDVPKDAAGKPVDKGEGPVLQALGDIAAVDLGERKGGCTFQHADGRDLMITGASADDGVVGNGAIRTQGVVVMLKTVGATGVNGLKAGTTLTDGNIKVQVAVGKKGKPEGGVSRTAANLGVTDKSGKQRLYSPGVWVCA